MKRKYIFILLLIILSNICISCSNVTPYPSMALRDSGQVLIKDEMLYRNIELSDNCRLLYTYFDGIRLYTQFEVTAEFTDKFPNLKLRLRESGEEYFPQIHSTYDKNQILYSWNVPNLNSEFYYSLVLIEEGVEIALFEEACKLDATHIDRYYEEIYVHEYMVGTSSTLMKITTNYVYEIEKVRIESVENGQVYNGHILDKDGDTLKIVFEIPIECEKKYIIHFSRLGPKTFSSVLFYN